VSREVLEGALTWQFHFDPDTYLDMMHSEMPAYERLQQEVAIASGSGARRILDLGTGTGETARRLLERHPDATLVGIDVSEDMLAAARAVLPGERVELRVGRLEEPLPPGPFDLVASALCIHHLDGLDKAALFKHVRAALAPGGSFVFGDVVVPEDPADAVTPLSVGYDRPSPLADQLGWLSAAGFEPRVTWSERDLAVVAATTADIVGER
jgi:tRNA (cmo5U34)-methyltransferase